MTLLKDIMDAREGKVITIPFRHKKLSRYIFMGKNMYHLIGGDGGSGKSAWVDLNYVIGLYIWYREIGQKENCSLKIILRSMERSKKLRIAKWVCMKLYLDHGILIDVPNLMGWGFAKNKINDELYEKVKKAYEWIEKMEDVVEIVDGATNPTGVFMHAKRYAELIGTTYYYEKIGSTLKFVKRKNGVTVKAEKEECPEASRFQSVYVPDNNRHITIHINDHLQAMQKESGYNDKQNLDKMSEYSRIMRDFYGMSPVIVNQLNRGISDTLRRVKTELLPQPSDFSGSSNMFFDADMAAILYNPYKYNLNEMKGYKMKSCINDFGINRFRSFHLLKNTYGPDNQIFAYQFVGENGLFAELPPPEELGVYDYRAIANPKLTENITNHK